MPKFLIQCKDSDDLYQIKIEKHTLILPGDFPWPPHLPSLPLIGDKHTLYYKLNSQSDINLQQKNEIKKFFQDSCQFSSDNDKQQFMSDFDQIFQSLNDNVNRKNALYRGIFFSIGAVILLAISAFLIVLLMATGTDLLPELSFVNQLINLLMKQDIEIILLTLMVPIVFTTFLTLCCLSASIVYLLDYFINASPPKNTAININDATLTTDCMALAAEDKDIEVTTETKDYELDLFNYQTSSKKTILPTKSEIKNQLQEAEDEKDLAKEKTDTNQSNFNPLTVD